MNLKAQLDAAYQKKVIDRLDKAVRLTVLSVHRELIFNTPVDTGRARGNWNVDINAIDVELRAPDKQGSQTELRGLEAVTRYSLNDTVFISNNLPYIRRLNDGHSKQAPAGFVEGAVQVGKAKAQELSR